MLGLPNDVHWECEKLKKLDFSHNRLRALPDTFNDLRSLNVMNLSHNYLKELPQSCSWGCINLVRRGGHVIPCDFVTHVTLGVNMRHCNSVGHGRIKNELSCCYGDSTISVVTRGYTLCTS